MIGDKHIFNSGFGELDSHGDVILKGSFDKSINENRYFSMDFGTCDSKSVLVEITQDEFGIHTTVVSESISDILELRKRGNTKDAKAKQSKFNNSFNVQTVEIIEETKTPVI